MYPRHNLSVVKIESCSTNNLATTRVTDKMLTKTPHSRLAGVFSQVVGCCFAVIIAAIIFTMVFAALVVFVFGIAIINNVVLNIIIICITGAPATCHPLACLTQL